MSYRKRIVAGLLLVICGMAMEAEAGLWRRTWKQAVRGAYFAYIPTTGTGSNNGGTGSNLNGNNNGSTGPDLVQRAIDDNIRELTSLIGKINGVPAADSNKLSLILQPAIESAMKLDKTAKEKLPTLAAALTKIAGDIKSGKFPTKLDINMAINKQVRGILKITEDSDDKELLIAGNLNILAEEKTPTTPARIAEQLELFASKLKDFDQPHLPEHAWPEYAWYTGFKSVEIAIARLPSEEKDHLAAAAAKLDKLEHDWSEDTNIDNYRASIVGAFSSLPEGDPTKKAVEDYLATLTLNELRGAVPALMNLVDQTRLNFDDKIQAPKLKDLLGNLRPLRALLAVSDPELKTFVTSEIKAIQSQIEGKTLPFKEIDDKLKALEDTNAPKPKIQRFIKELRHQVSKLTDDQDAALLLTAILKLAAVL